MNGKKKTIILFVLFVILMFAASVLYNSLSENYKMDSLVVENEINSSANSSKENDNANTTDSSSENSNTDTTDSSSENNSTNTTDSSSENSNNMTAPDFTVYDLEGNQVHLSDFFGKPIILNFWASWCGPCKMEMPDFNTAYATYKEEISFLMINMTDGSRETIETASSFITEQGYSFPVFYDTDYSAAITYSATSLPTTYFIDANGNLIAHAKGAIDADTLQKGIDMIYVTKAN